MIWYRYSTDPELYHPQSYPFRQNSVCTAVSRNDGESFDAVHILEDDPDLGYCYPAIFDGGDYILVGYYVLEGKDRNLDSNKIIKIQKSEL